MENKGEIVLYNPIENENALQVTLYDETVWLSQKQLSILFDIQVPTVNEHIKNIYNDSELNEESTIRKFLIVQKENERKVKRDIVHYNLDVILSVGYRVNSKKGTQFRIWATKILKDHLVKGFSINSDVLKENRNRLLVLQSSLDLMQRAANVQSIDINQARSLIELVSKYTKSFTLLNEYDTNSLILKKQKKATFQLQYDLVKKIIEQLKKDLYDKKVNFNKTYSIDKKEIAKAQIEYFCHVLDKSVQNIETPEYNLQHMTFIEKCYA